MTHISKNNLEQREYQEAYKEFVRLVGKKPENVKIFLDELLTEPERIMLTKRFAATLIYCKDRPPCKYNPYKVSQLLGISLSTAQRIQKQYRDGKYSKLMQTFLPISTGAMFGFMTVLSKSSSGARARSRIASGSYKH